MKPETTQPAAAPPRKDEPRAVWHTPRSRLGLEITVVLCVKLLLLLLLREVWFSQPTSKSLTERSVAAALFGPVNGPPPGEERKNDSRP